MNPTDIVARASQHQFIGRLGADPELKSFQSGACVAKGRLAINHPDAKRDDKNATDWFSVELWNQEAERFVDEAHKGDELRIWGRVKTERYETRDGEQRTSIIIKPTSWEVMPRRERVDQPSAAAPARRPAAAAAPAWQSNGPTDDEVPF
jgi:single-strand DNA-binding protein